MCRYFSLCRPRVCFGLRFGFCWLRISAGSSSLVSSSTLTLWDMCLWKCLLPISPLMRVISYVSFICEEDYSVLACNPFSGLNTALPSFSNPLPGAKAQTLNLRVSRCLWEPTTDSVPPRAVEMGHVVIQPDLSCMSQAKSCFYGLLIHSCFKWFTYRCREPS